MTMQIKSVVIYHKNGQTRLIDFRLGQVNIITGNSNTGKSALIDIVEYCLAGSEYRVKLRPEVLKNVAAFGVLYQLNDRQVFVAKHVAETRTQSSLFFAEALELEIPMLNDLKYNYVDDDLKLYLASLIGIQENTIEPGSNLPKYTANIRHTTYYTFLDKPIDNEFLFYKQGNREIARTIKETMPVLLKVVEPDYTRLQNELRQNRAEQRRIKTEIDNINSISVASVTLVPSLLREAQSLGLLSSDLKVDEVKNGREILLGLVDDGIPNISLDTDYFPLTDLQEKHSRLEQEYVIEKARLAEYKAYSQESNLYQHYASEHDHRLEVSDYFDASDQDVDICPICGSHIEGYNPDVQDLQEARRQIQLQLKSAKVRRPVLTDVIDSLQTHLRNLSQEIRQVRADIEIAIEMQQQQTTIHIPRQRIARFLGQVDMYLRLAPVQEDSLSRLNAKLQEIETEIAQLQRQIEEAEGIEQLESAIVEISSYMSIYGSQIGDEYRGAFFRFDLNNLKVFVSQRADIVEFPRNVGSDKNYLQIHLILYLALQRYFIVHQCPVPSFIIIDQVDRPFYPNDVSYDNIVNSNPEEMMEDPDRQALLEVFELFYKVCDDLGIQIIVLQHANFPDKDYQNAVIENWRDGHALIPNSWIEINPE